MNDVNTEFERMKHDLVTIAPDYAHVARYNLARDMEWLNLLIKVESCALRARFKDHQQKARDNLSLLAGVGPDRFRYPLERVAAIMTRDFQAGVRALRVMIEVIDEYFHNAQTAHVRQSQD